MYHLHGSFRSRAFRVMWALEEMGETYEHSNTQPRTPEIIALNPNGKIPVLLVDGVPLTDSTAILTYLADKHGKLTYPPGTIERARQDGWTQMVLDELDGTLWTSARHSFGLPEELRMPEIKDSLRWEFAQSCKRIATLVEGPFIMGDRMTLPDIVLGHCLGWAAVAKFPCDEPVLADYSARLRARPAYKAAQAR